MLARVAAFEFRYLLKNPLLWLTAAAVFLMPFASLALGLELEEDVRVFKNSPYEVISKYRMISCLFMFAAAVFVSNIVLRDDETAFGPILRSTGLSKFDYLIGRFLGAFAIVALCLTLVTPGIWIGSLVAGAGAEGIGPNRFGDHLYAYLLIALPNVLITASIFFALATLSRSMTGTYLGVVAFLLLYFTLNDTFGDRADLVQTAAVVEPFAGRAFDDAVRYWTTPERNALLPPFSGALLYNRLLWIGISLLFLALAFFGFNFADKSGGRRNRRKQRLADLAAAAHSGAAPAPRPLAAPEYGRRAAWALLAVRTRFEMKQVLKSPAFIILMFWAACTTLFVLITQRHPEGRPSHPLTVTLIPELEEIFFILPLVLVIIYAGELVWRERDRRMHEIVDAAPHPNWAYVVPKTAAIALVLFSIFLVSAGAAIATQLSLGFTRVEPLTYLLWYVLPMTWDAMLAAALAVFVQVLSPHKFVGFAIMVLYVAAQFTGYMPDHNLLNHGETPPTPYSDMDGVSSFWVGPWVFRLYWGALAVLLLVAAHLLWRRGTEVALRPRLKRAAGLLTGAPRIAAAGALLTFAATGAYAYYNTNVLNRYETPEASDAYWAEYEKRYMKYDGLAQPSVVHVALDVALYPGERRAAVRGSYLLRNLTDAPIQDVHVLVRDRALKLAAAAVAGGRLAFEDADYGYRIYRLDRPMAPGETRRMTFETERHNRGFANGAPDTSIVANGTFLADDQLLPAVGMSGEPKVTDPAVRREHGLPPLRGLARLEDAAAANVPSGERSWTTADITLSTEAGQTPIAPGRKVSDVTAGGRRTARFVSDAPIRSAFAVQSARYAERRRRYGNVDLAVFHHPGHEWNVDRMLNALQASLAYYEANFGPYQFRQARVIEFPSYGRNFAQAFANTVPNAETYGFMADLGAPGALDYVSGAMAHEMAHQYWGHQLTPAAVEGSLLLTETLAQYSAIMVMRRLNGEAQVRRQMRLQLAYYLSGRAWEQRREVPLVRVEGQSYLHYNKGALAMYLLQERLGEARVNRALRRLLERYRFRGAPYPRSLDLVAALRAEAASAEDQALITDLFERITLYDLKAAAPTARRLPDGRWEVTVPVEARKYYGDAEGAEREAPLADRIEIGLFAAAPGAESFDRRDVIAMQRMPVRSGRRSYRFVVDRQPLYAGIDPYNLYIDRNAADNVAPVEVLSAD
jgi:ABC-type transport system involved in multi-copper enzyme maturation permease subunit